MKNTLNFLFLSIINMVCVGSRKVKSTFVISTCAWWCRTYSRSHIHTHTHTHVSDADSEWEEELTAFCSFLPSVQKVWVRFTHTHCIRTPPRTRLSITSLSTDEGQWKRKTKLLIVKIDFPISTEKRFSCVLKDSYIKVIVYLLTVWRTSIQLALEKKLCSLNMKASVCVLFAVACWLVAQADESPMILTLGKVMNDLGKIKKAMVSWFQNIYGWDLLRSFYTVFKSWFFFFFFF